MKSKIFQLLDSNNCPLGLVVGLCKAIKPFKGKEYALDLMEEWLKGWNPNTQPEKRSRGFKIALYVSDNGRTVDMKF